jgi:hypothetical protein
MTFLSYAFPGDIVVSFWASAREGFAVTFANDEARPSAKGIDCGSDH